jgi:hypothetical protein
VIRSEAVCESAASILNQHIHENRALDHESSDEGVMLNWNAPSLYLADPLVKFSSSNKYFLQLKDKHWIFFKKTAWGNFWKIFSRGRKFLIFWKILHLWFIAYSTCPECIDILYNTSLYRRGEEIRMRGKERDHHNGYNYEGRYQSGYTNKYVYRIVMNILSKSLL